MPEARPKRENPMRRAHIEKVVLNIGVGKSGEQLEKAKTVLKTLTGEEPKVTLARKSIKDFKIHRGETIGAMVTLRKKKAIELLKRLLIGKGLKLKSSCFDERGNVSFGLKEHIDIPGVKYNPAVGIFGLNVSIRLARPGFRVLYRKRLRGKIRRSYFVTRDEAISFFRDRFKVVVE